MSKEFTLTKEQAEEFYAEHKESEFFETLVTNMSRFVHDRSYIINPAVYLNALSLKQVRTVEIPHNFNNYN